jgi:precorrin-3B synthase
LVSRDTIGTSGPLAGTANQRLFVVGVGLPFGEISAADFAYLAASASASGASELRLTPWRAILIPIPSPDAARALAQSLDADRFILDATDPRRRIAACPGAPACARGTTATRENAARMAAKVGDAPGSGIVLHVSGCEKGCAHPRRAAVTLVARHGRYDLVRAAEPWAAPVARALTVDQATDAVARILPRADALP